MMNLRRERKGRTRKAFEELFGPKSQRALPISRGPDGRYLDKETWNAWCRFSSLCRQIDNPHNAQEPTNV